MKKIVCLSAALMLLCASILLIGCGESKSHTDLTMPTIPSNSSTSEIALTTIASQTTTSTAPVENMTAKQSLLALGYDIGFAIDGYTETDSSGFEFPASNVDVILLRIDGQQIGYLAHLEGFIGNAMIPEEDGWCFDEEQLADIYKLPQNTVAGTEFYYAGAGDQVFVSFDPLEGLITVWHREFFEGGFDTPIEDTVDEWEAVSSINIADFANK